MEREKRDWSEDDGMNYGKSLRWFELCRTFWRLSRTFSKNSRIFLAHSWEWIP